MIIVAASNLSSNGMRWGKDGDQEAIIFPWPFMVTKDQLEALFPNSERYLPQGITYVEAFMGWLIINGRTGRAGIFHPDQLSETNLADHFAVAKGEEQAFYQLVNTLVNFKKEGP